MSYKDKRRKKENKEKQLKAKKEFSKRVNEAAISCGYCRVKNKNNFFYNGIGFCSKEHEDLWKKQRGIN